MVTIPTTTQATWSSSTTSNAAPLGWLCMPDLFSFVWRPASPGPGDCPVTVMPGQASKPVP
jgi:hypothetical protein